MKDISLSVDPGWNTVLSRIQKVQTQVQESEDLDKIWTN
jgi:hypothetical protein